MKWTLKGLHLLAEAEVEGRLTEVKIHIRIVDLDDPHAIVQIIGEELAGRLMEGRTDGNSKDAPNFC